MGLFGNLDPLARRSNAAPPRSAGRIAAEVALTAAVLGVGGLVAYWLRERASPEADHRTVRQEGPFSLRRYTPMVVATAEANGLMTDALGTAFSRLFAYISGKERGTDAEDQPIAMTVPVLAAPGTHPGSWKVRFVMPSGDVGSVLPEPPAGIVIEELPGRLVAAVRFPGRADDRLKTAGRRDDLLAWVRSEGLSATGEPEFASYNAPIIPALARSNEWWVEVAEPTST